MVRKGCCCRRAEAIRADPRVLPQSTLGKAVRYLLNEYTALVGYLRDGRFEIDSNLVENVIQSFGLRFLSRDACNAENPPRRTRATKPSFERRIGCSALS